LMETLADYGVVSYFGVQSFTAGIYKAWLAMDDRIAAAQLAVLLLVCVAVLLKIERKAQAKMRFAATRGGAQPQALHPLPRGQAWLAALACASPVMLGFVLPVLVMLWPLMAGPASAGADVDAQVVQAAQWARFWQASGHSLSLALAAACITVVVAAALAACVRLRAGARLPVGVARVAELGYATPGAVIVVGLLLPVAWLQSAAPALQAGYWLTATVLGVLWAYTVRFSAVALQSVQAGYARLPVSVDESARMLGVGAWGSFLRLHLPLLRKPLAAAGLLVFVDVMKELPATLVLRPFNTDTLAVLAHQLAKDERLAEAALPSLAIVAVGLIPVLLLNRLLDKR
jgi:iron(III) transport system permease protein